MKQVKHIFPKIKKRWRIILIGCVIFVAFMAPSYYFYNKYRELDIRLNNPQAARAGAVKDVVEQVGARIVLPKGETPQLVTVSDTGKLSGLPFFKNARNGDKVLLYESAKMAYLYRPSTKELINAAPIIEPGAALEQSVTSEGSGSANQVTVTPSPVIVAVYNGTTTAGLARTTGEKIKAAYPQATLGVTANAAGDHTATIVVDLKGTNKAVADTIAKAVGGQVSSLPEGEKAPANADILVIAGAN